MNIQQKVSLQAFNTMAVPSQARYFARALTEQEVRDALGWARKREIPVSILGGGSNCLLPETIAGLVLQPAIRGIEVLEENSRFVWVKAACGENWHRFVQHCLGRKFYGLENLALIPGLVGAAPIQNIGAYGVELQDFVVSLDAIDRVTREKRTFDKAACEFGYRDSIFKNALKNRYVIVSVTFRLLKQPEIRDHYPALKSALSGLRRSVLTPEIVAHTVMEIRRSKLPSPDMIPNVGSFFKNPVVDNSVVTELRDLYPDLVAFPVDAGHQKIAAGWLIEKSGWKGREAFEVRVHDQQALVLTNPKHASSAQVMRLARAIQSNIKARFGIELEQEPQLLEAS